jgi:microcystin-dependent protein
MEVFMGFVSPYPYNWAPNGWALCNGALVPIQQYQAIFALLGTQFGGNGTTTFGLPDLRGRTIVGMGQQPGGTNYLVGAFGGKENVTLISNQVPTPALSANVAVSTAAATTATPALTNGQTAYLANAAAGSAANALKGLYTTTAPTQGSIANVPVTLSGGGGGGSPVPVMNPYLALNFCIAMTGIFPSRN